MGKSMTISKFPAGIDLTDGKYQEIDVATLEVSDYIQGLKWKGK